MDFDVKWIAWEITRRCNLGCVHCRSSSQLEAKEHPDFSFEEAKRALDDISSYAQPVVVLSGGEPLLREDVFDIAAYGTEKGLRMCLATNGTLVTDEICQKIKQAGIRMVSLSLDGASAEVHDDFRNQLGAFDGTLQGCCPFQEAQNPFPDQLLFYQAQPGGNPKGLQTCQKDWRHCLVHVHDCTDRPRPGYHG